MASPILIVADPPRLYRGSGKTLAIREKEKEWAAGKKGKGRGKPIGSADGKAGMRRSGVGRSPFLWKRRRK